MSVVPQASRGDGRLGRKSRRNPEESRHSSSWFGPLAVLGMDGAATYDPAPARMGLWHDTSLGKDLGTRPGRILAADRRPG
jgi:hypothetical protein